MIQNKIAVIGYGLNVAGAKSSEALFSVTSKGLTALKKYDPSTLPDDLPESLTQNPRFIAVGGGPDDIQTFDANFFGYSPKDASLMDPQTRKALELAYHTVEAAGYQPRALKGQTSCYIANSVNSYFQENLQGYFQNQTISEQSHILFLNEPDFLATRMAYHFNWHGSAFTIKCGCSSSMVAIHQACQALLQYECDQALAGGVNIKYINQFGYLYEQDGILSKTGRCSPFSSDADGTIFSNGLGFVLLKRLDDAMQDGDQVHAIIHASYVNNDGNDKVGYMAPSVSGQVNAMKTVLAFAELAPADISYIEAHGTGTPIGDPIEYEALSKVFKNCGREQIALRSVKANLGHLDCASGVIGLIKVITDMKYKAISPNANFVGLNPKCNAIHSPFGFSTELKTWHPVNGRRISVVSSFGIGGTNAQLILEDPASLSLTTKRSALPLHNFDKQSYWIGKEEYKNQKINDVSQWFYMPYWQRDQRPIPPLQTFPKTVLYFDDESLFSDIYCNALSKIGAKVVRVKTAIANIDANIKAVEHGFALVPSLKEHYQQLALALKSQQYQIDTMIHAWSLHTNLSDHAVTMNHGFYSALFTIQALEEVFETIPQTIQLITNKSANVSGSEPILPLNNLFIGMSQVIPKEYEGVICQLIDIVPEEHGVVPFVLEELSRNKNCEVALRGCYRFVKAYQPMPLTRESLGPISIQSGKNYLVIGGLGNFGMELSEFIGAKYKGRVFLTTRMKFPKRLSWAELIAKDPESTISQKIRMILELEDLGTEVYILQADVLDIASLQKAKTYIESNFGPLSVVVHAAGIVDSGMIRHKTKSGLEDVFAAKIYGTQNVADVFLNESLDLMILCSSMNAIIGGLGQLDNTAANAFIDGFAELCANQGLSNVIAINWGAVNEARARHYSANAQFKKLSEEHIKNKMDKSEIFEVYHRLFSSHIRPRVVVSTINFNQVIEQWSRVGSLKSLVQNKINNKRSREESANFSLAETEVECCLANIWQDLLGIETVYKEDDFFVLGGNSLIAIQFISALTKQYPIKIHAMTIYEYPVLERFARHATQLIKEQVEKQALMLSGLE